VSMQQSGMKAGLLDSLLVFVTVIAIGSICSIVLLRDLDRYWRSVGGALEKVTPGPEQDGEAPPEAASTDD